METTCELCSCKLEEDDDYCKYCGEVVRKHGGEKNAAEVRRRR